VVLIPVSWAFSQEMQWWLGASHPVLSQTLSVYFPQISSGTHLELGQFWLSLQGHVVDSFGLFCNEENYLKLLDHETFSGS